MRSWVLVVGCLIAVVGCGKRTVRGGTTTAGAADEPAGDESGGDEDTGEPSPGQPTAAVHLALELRPADSGSAASPMTAVQLSITDETGAVTHQPVGEFLGVCTDVTPAERAAQESEARRPLLAVRCEHAESGARASVVHLLYRSPRLLVLRRWLDDPDQFYDEVGSIDLTAGARVTTDHP